MNRAQKSAVRSSMTVDCPAHKGLFVLTFLMGKAAGKLSASYYKKINLDLTRASKIWELLVQRASWN